MIFSTIFFPIFQFFSGIVDLHPDASLKSASIMRSSMSFPSFPLFHLVFLMVMTSVRNICACANEKPWTPEGKKKQEPVNSTSRRGARAAYHDEYPRDFGPRIAYTVSSVSDTCRPPIRQGGREMSAPRPYETYPFHQLCSVHILNNVQFLYILKIVPAISPIWY